MKKFKIQHEELFEKVRERIEELFDNGNGVKSDHNDRRVIRVPKEQAFNLDGGRHLTEIGIDKLVDNEGYGYSLSALTLEQLCEVVDAISEFCDF